MSYFVMRIECFFICLGLLTGFAQEAVPSEGPALPLHLQAGFLTWESNRTGDWRIFTRNGVWGYWVQGMGGPMNRYHISSGETGIILDKNDPRMPEDRGYIYFPHISPCRQLLVFAASADEHDHHTSDYDLFVAALNPSTLELSADPIRSTAHQAMHLDGGAFLAEEASEPLLNALRNSNTLTIEAILQPGQEGSFASWEKQTLLFGAETDGSRDWSGTLEGVAIYARVLSAEEDLPATTLGQSTRLILEPLAAHSHLETLFPADALEPDFDTPVFLDVTP